MQAAIYLLFVIGVLGAADILFFHILAQRIRHNPESRLELQIHSLRGPTYCSPFIPLLNYAMQGGYYWLLMGLLVVDFSISMWDFSIEKRSRRSLGGLPTGEYLVHAIIAMLYGAMAACLLWVRWEWASLSTRFAYEAVGVLAPLRWIMTFLMAPMVLIFGIQDASAAFRLSRIHREPAPDAG